MASGIVTDDNNKVLFSALIENKQLVHAWDFENREGIFRDVDSRFKFLLLCACGFRGQHAEADLAFYLTSIEELSESERHFTLTADELSLLNPNSRTCPTFRNKREAEITKSIYKNVPARALHKASNGWPGTPKTPFNMSNDSALFLMAEDVDELDRQNRTCLPLYESKFIHQFNHRFATFTSDAGAGAQEFSLTQLDEPSRFVHSRYWLPKRLLDQRYPGRWFLVYRKITCATNERTSLASIIPEAPCGDSLILIEDVTAPNAAVLNSILNSFVYDYCARQKVAGTNFNHWIWNQLPIASADQIGSQCRWGGGTLTLKEWLLPRALELTCTAWDLEAFAVDCGWSGPPFRWNEERRFLLRCELDAAFFHLYGLNRDDTAYVLDTFPILKRKDEAKFGDYRTKLVILKVYDAMKAAIESGQPYQTLLNPPPASLCVAHSFDWPRKPFTVPEEPRVAFKPAENYAAAAMLELLFQSNGRLPWDELRKSWRLLSDPKDLARRAEAMFGAEVQKWKEQFNDKLALDDLVDMLSGFCHAGTLWFGEQDGTKIVELRNEKDFAYFPHVRCDCRLALSVAASMPAEPALSPQLAAKISNLEAASRT